MLPRCLQSWLVRYEVCPVKGAVAPTVVKLDIGLCNARKYVGAYFASNIDWRHGFDHSNKVSSTTRRESSACRNDELVQLSLLQ